LVAGGWARRSGAPMALAYLDIDHFAAKRDGRDGVTVYGW
jgi:GGDEF domain-containing protein